MRSRTLVLAVALLAASCAGRGPVAVPGSGPLQAPGSIAASVIVLTAESPEYVRADVAAAVKPAGEGNVYRAMVVQLTRDILVYRMWNGPASVDANGRTNRIGSWWTYDVPRGAQRDYRRSYEICTVWNTLAFVATCTLKKGAVVAIGPGNSVSARTCGDPTGREAYPPNDRNWQLYLSKAFERIGPGKELECPDVAEDYEAEPSNLARRKTPAGR